MQKEVMIMLIRDNIFKQQGQQCAVNVIWHVVLVLMVIVALDAHIVYLLLH
jgi:hypothetical protein